MSNGPGQLPQALAAWFLGLGLVHLLVHSLSCWELLISMYLRNIPMAPFCNPTHRGLLHLTAKCIPDLYLNPDFPHFVASTEEPQPAISNVVLCPPWGSRVIILVVELSPQVLAPES